MSRLQQYRRQTGATTLNTPGAVRITAPPQGADRAARELLTSLQGAIQQTGKVLAREHVLTQQTRMDESLLAARQEFSEWQAAYMQEHQGGNALEAGKDFREKFAEIAGRHLEAFDGAENEVFRGLLGGRLAAEGLRASEQGLSYAARQKAVWEDSVRKGRLAMLEQDAYSDPENGAWLDTQRAAILQDAEARGQDVTALNRSLTSAVQLARIRGLADRGDLDGASRLLAGSVPGILFLKNADTSLVKLFFGAAIVLVGVEMLWSESHPAKGRGSRLALGVIGVLSGLLCGLYGVGALLGAYVSRVTEDSHGFKANICVVFFAENTLRLVLYSLWGILTPASLFQALTLAPAMLAGLGLGIFSSRYLDEKRIKKAVILLLIFSGAALVAGQL